MRYMVVRHHRLEDFVDVVNAYLADGWKPQGGVAYDDTSVNKTWAQALVKEKVDAGRLGGGGGNNG